jgi:4-aminobutyrate aminotransferase-like enzyme
MDSADPGALGGTYGGNPVACAAALEAIGLIEKDRLVDRAQALGAKLSERLRSLEAQHPLIGEVRGVGAMMAIELVKDRSSRAPAPEATQKIVATARERGLLLLPTGTQGNVIRFLMPLTIEDAVLEEGLAILEHAIEGAMI